jgi:predicted RNase H-like nuclease
MPLAAGVDGCRKGWICVTRRGGRVDSACYENVDALLGQRPRPAMVGIDMPIGLPERGARDCDRAARRLLGRRRSSVFPAPIRAVLPADSWADACSRRERVEDKRMSVQAWAIVAKVRDLDRALRRSPDRRIWVREVHPEVSFLAWNGALAPSKKSREGREARLRLVAREFGSDAYRGVRARYLVKDVGHDDILDAFAALWTAERVLRGEERQAVLERAVARDAHGLSMEIVY